MKKLIVIIALLMPPQFINCSQENNSETITITSKDYNLENSRPIYPNVRHLNGILASQSYWGYNKYTEHTLQFLLSENSKEILEIILYKNLLYPSSEWAITFKKENNFFTVNSDVGSIKGITGEITKSSEFDIYENEYYITTFDFNDTKE